jgi:hypothetical protein
MELVAELSIGSSTGAILACEASRNLNAGIAAPLEPSTAIKASLFDAIIFRGSVDSHRYL